MEGTAREILGDVEIDEESDGGARDDLEQMLIDIITDAGGSMSTKALMAEVRDSGHSWDTAKRLKKSMGIESRKLSMGGPWMWFLPTAAARREHEGSEGSEGSTENKALPSLPSVLPSQ